MPPEQPPATARRVLIAGERPLLNESLSRHLSSWPGVVAVAGQGVAETTDDGVPFDVVVVPVGDDVSTDEASVRSLTEAVKPEVTIVLVPPPTGLWERRASAAGWWAISLDDDGAALAAAIAGTAVRPSPEPGGGLAAPTGLTPHGGLTPRELDVLRSLASGNTSAGISGQLGLSPHTVRSHIRSLTQKLGVTSRTDAAAAGRRAGYLPAVAGGGEPNSDGSP